MNGNAGTLYVDDGGVEQGRVPVVLVHAAAGETGHWEAQLKHLRRTRRAVALDLRGHGRSALADGAPVTLRALAGDVGAVLDGLGLPQAVLVGHSLGGAVCALYAGEHPGRVAGLFLLDPASDGRKVPPEALEGFMPALRDPATCVPTVEAYWAPMLAPSRPEVRARVLAGLRRTATRAIAEPLEDLFAHDPVAPLLRYGGPKRTVVTDFNEEEGSLQRLVPGLPWVKVDGVGHWLQLDAPERVNAELDGFLAGEVDGRGR
jgi:pimeloyl-ACP methyl ester carboxylesterase